MSEPKDWVTIQPNLDQLLVIPNAVIEAIDSVLQFLITVLNIANIILNVVKVFLVGLLNPIRAIVEAIIEEIRAFIRDLRQLGLYMCGDYNLITIKPLRAPELLGGFQAYERRMLKRLLNRRDPGRPDFSSRSVALGLFCYLSTGDLFALIELINRIKAFFGDRDTREAPLPQPTQPEATLGTYGLSTALFKKPDGLDAAPDAVTLKWTMPGFGTPFSKPPGGFLVHVSTVPNGFGLRSMKWQSTGTDVDVQVPSYQPAVGIDSSTGTELRLFGGICDLATGKSDYSDVEAGSKQAHRLFLSLDQNTPLFVPSTLESESGGTPIGGATYFIKLPKFNKVAPMQSYRATLKVADLPQTFTIEPDGVDSNDLPKVKAVAEDCYTFYARVRPVTDDYVAALGLDGTSAAPTLVGPKNMKIAHHSSTAIQANTKALFKPMPAIPTAYRFAGLNGVTPQELGPPSAPAVFSVPTPAMLGFLTALETSLQVLMLLRADYTEAPTITVEGVDTIQGSPNTYAPGYATGLEGLKDFLTQMGVTAEWYESSRSSKKFRRKLRRNAAFLMDRFLAQPPPQTVVEALAEDVENLNTFKWSDIASYWPDMTILESVKSQNANAGVAASPIGVGTPLIGKVLGRGTVTGSTLLGDWPDRNPCFPERLTPSGGNFVDFYMDLGRAGNAFYMGDGWSDYTPVLYSTGDMSQASIGRYTLDAQFVRKLLLDYEDAKILNSAIAILSVAGAANARSPSESDWKAIRVFDKMLAPLDQLLTDIEAFLLAILDGLQGLIDKIIAYIEAIQARIFQLQALIEMIRALLQALTAFDLPSFSGLLLVENGTDGITKGLVTAGNKPSDTPLSYGGGVLIMAGGLPVILAEILELILGGGSE